MLLVDCGEALGVSSARFVMGLEEGPEVEELA